jgi:hypothetical protein
MAQRYIGNSRYIDLMPENDMIITIGISPITAKALKQP